MTTDIISTARAAGVHPLATSEEYLGGLERFAAVFREEHAAHIYRLREEIMQQENEMYRLREQRDALLEACRFYASMMGRRKSDGEPFYMTALDLDCGDRARAAIAKAEGEKT